MYCTLCVREKKHNVFTAGTSNFRQAAVAIPSLQRYQRTVGSIYGYFSNSSSRQARLKEMHVILDTDDVQPAVTSTINALPSWITCAQRDGNLSFTRTPAAQSGHLLRSWSMQTTAKIVFQELVKIMATQHAGFLSETTKLLAAISVIPMRTVPCGRGFSIQNRIKTKGRARIKAENLD
ncbi:hypothetical protein KUCAC02_010317 [Chaenocephalus aceratus]|uniref:Uncharacterized protein n=1 Tax=Chaenocephalus aceratus TaxID=36190 RepID=A0ACB9VZI5_CHAAC|nr:hypothetical protein KUCAC02_010317 [Chaenocephalus aceratus]